MADDRDNGIRDDIYSKAVRAGKRTYFFDVKATRGNDLYLTITESKKKFEGEGKFSYEKHKLFLYKEDFEKFLEGLQEAVDRIHYLRENDDQYAEAEAGSNHTSAFAEDHATAARFTDVDFDDLGNHSQENND